MNWLEKLFRRNRKVDVIVKPFNYMQHFVEIEGMREGDKEFVNDVRTYLIVYKNDLNKFESFFIPYAKKKYNYSIFLKRNGFYDSEYLIKKGEQYEEG